MRPLWVIHERTLRDLERQAARGDPIYLEQVSHRGEELLVVQRAGREIDRHLELEPALLPVPALAYRSLKHPTRQRANEPGALGQRNELIRRDEAMHRMRPAHEHLDP